MLAGLRRGELMGLRGEEVDLKADTLRVERSYQPRTREFVTPKSSHGVRTVPITGALKPHLVGHGLATDRRAGLVFGDTAEPFRPESVHERAPAAWGDKLDHITPPLLQVPLHLGEHRRSRQRKRALPLHGPQRHPGLTYDLYGHLFPGKETEAAQLLDTYLARAFRQDSPRAAAK
jgi:hypothetical protein